MKCAREKYEYFNFILFTFINQNQLCHVIELKGPVFPEPLKDPSDLQKLTVDGAVSRLTYVGDAITRMRHLLEGKVPLFGFSGAPVSLTFFLFSPKGLALESLHNRIYFQWTLMGYMIEGGGSKTMEKAKHWLTAYESESKHLLTLLSQVVVDYFEMQVKAGAQMLQLFESSAEHLSKELFLKISLVHVKYIRDSLRERLIKQNIEPVPMVLFAKGAGHSLKEQAELGFEVIGLDWTVDPIEARNAVGPNVTLQGNLNPEDMYKSPVSHTFTINHVYFISLLVVCFAGGTKGID